jgi:DNA gyrase subunit A
MSIKHRREVVTYRTASRLRKAETHPHLLAGFQITLEKMNEFVRIIRAANNREDAKIALVTKLH